MGEEYLAEREDQESGGEVPEGSLSPLEGDDLGPEREQELLEDEYGVEVMGPDAKARVEGNLERKKGWMDETRFNMARCEGHMDFEVLPSGKLLLFESRLDMMGRRVKYDVFGNKIMPVSELRPGWFEARQWGRIQQNWPSLVDEELERWQAYLRDLKRTRMTSMRIRYPL